MKLPFNIYQKTTSGKLSLLNVQGLNDRTVPSSPSEDLRLPFGN